MKTGRYLDDFKAGQTFASGTFSMTTENIVDFARQYDPQPFHTDPESAPDSFFQAHVASGWQTAAVTMRLLVGSGLDVQGGLIGAAVDEMRWPRPVYPGDVLRAETEVLEVIPSKSRPDRGRLRVRVTTRNQKGETVQRMTATIVLPKQTSPRIAGGGS